MIIHIHPITGQYRIVEGISESYLYGTHFSSTPTGEMFAYGLDESSKMQAEILEVMGNYLVTWTEDCPKIVKNSKL